MLGALWPFILFGVLCLFRSGANIEVDGPMNWADLILGYCMIASFAGCFFLVLLFAAVLAGFFVTGYVSASIVVALRRRGHSRSF